MKDRKTAAKIAAFVSRFAQLEDDGEGRIIDGQTKSQVIAAAAHLKLISEARAKGGRANKKFASDKERYAFHNAKRKKKRKVEVDKEEIEWLR